MGKDLKYCFRLLNLAVKLCGGGGWKKLEEQVRWLSR